MIRKQSRMKGNDVERLRKQRGKHWGQESIWYVRTYELPSILGVRRTNCWLKLTDGVRFVTFAFII